jgi:hypothetical protein
MAGQNLIKMRQCGTNDAYGAEKSIKGQQKLQNIAQNKWLRAKTILCVVFLINILSDTVHKRFRGIVVDRGHFDFPR